MSCPDEIEGVGQCAIKTLYLSRARGLKRSVGDKLIGEKFDLLTKFSQISCHCVRRASRFLPVASRLRRSRGAHPGMRAELL
jgi:hypothetical protein